MRKIILLSFICLSSLKGFATVQAKELLIDGRDTMIILNYTMESSRKVLDERYVLPEFTWYTTGLYRGYIATWEIVGDSVYLTGISGNLGNNELTEIDLSTIFGDDCIDGKVFAWWLTKTLYVQYGRLTCVSDKAGGQWEFEKRMEIEGGLLVCEDTYETTIRHGNADLNVCDPIEDNGKWIHRFVELNIGRAERVPCDNAVRRVLLLIKPDETGSCVSVYDRGEHGLSACPLVQAVMRILEDIKWDRAIREGKPFRDGLMVPFWIDGHNWKVYGRPPENDA